MKRIGKFLKGLKDIKFFDQNPTAEELAKAIHDGNICMVAIDERIQPWGNARQAFPRSTIFEGKRKGERWTLSAHSSVIDLDPAAPAEVRKLFLDLACKVTGEAALCAEYLKRHGERLRLNVAHGDGMVTVSLCDKQGVALGSS